MKLERAKIMVVLLAVGGLVFAAAQISFLILPTYRDVKDLGGKIVAAETEVQAQYANRKNLLATASQIEEARKTIDLLGTQFIGAGGELSFITALEAIADKNGVDLRKSLVAGAGEYPEFNRGVDITLNGRYRDVLRTIVDIERMPALVAISSYTMTGSGGATPDDTSVSVGLHGTVASPPKGL